MVVLVISNLVGQKTYAFDCGVARGAGVEERRLSVSCFIRFEAEKIAPLVINFIFGTRTV